MKSYLATRVRKRASFFFVNPTCAASMRILKITTSAFMPVIFPFIPSLGRWLEGLNVALTQLILPGLLCSTPTLVVLNQEV